MLAKRYPNKNVAMDRTKISIAGVGLIVIGVLNFLFASIMRGMIMSRGIRMQGMANTLTMILVVCGGLYLVAGIGTLKNSSGSAMMGLILSILAFLGSLRAMNMIGVSIHGVLVLLLAQAYNQLSGINKRILSPTQDNHLTAYYHALIPILVRVMEADGDCDKRERKKIAQICKGMNISNYELRFLVNRFRGGEEPIEALVGNYVNAKKKLDMPASNMQLVVCALAVAAADGIFVEEEIELIRQIGESAQVDSGRVEALIQQEKAKMEDLTPAKAYVLLNVKKGASAEVVERGYQKFVQELTEDKYSHIGHKMQEYVDQRLKIIEKAYQILKAG